MKLISRPQTLTSGIQKRRVKKQREWEGLAAGIKGVGDKSAASECRSLPPSQGRSLWRAA